MAVVDQSGQRLIVFGLAEQSYALDAASIREVVPVGPLTVVPGLPEWARGVMRMRDEVVLVADLRTCLGLEVGTASEVTRVLVATAGDRALGLLVDAVTEVRALDADDAAALNKGARHRHGVTAHFDGREVLVLDVEAVFALAAVSAERSDEAPPAQPIDLVPGAPATRSAAPAAAEHSNWEALVEQGTANALVGLSRMIGRDAEMSALHLRKVATAEIIGELAPEDSAVAIHLGVTGAATGDIVLIYERATACAFADLLMVQPIGTTTDLGEIERSALSEMGNVLAGFFLNALADASGLNLIPSPPTMLIGDAAELRTLVSTAHASEEHAYLSEALFHVDAQEVAGSFFVAPSAELVRVLDESMAGQLAAAA